MKILYAHGFASGPQSRKAEAFRFALAAGGVELLVPALDGGDFEHLTISGQLSVIKDLLGTDGDPVRLIGSSMGGYLAALYASLHGNVDRLVLLAPALDFAPRWKARMPHERDFEVYHYGERRPRRVWSGLIEDAMQYPAIPSFGQRALIFHGVNDDVVPVTLSRDFAATHPNVTLRELNSDHELTDQLDGMTREGVEFLLQPA